MKSQFRFAARQDLEDALDTGYTNAVYADGTPFPAYKQSAGQLFTDYTSSGQRQSNMARQANLPTNNNALRNFQIKNAVDNQNKQNIAWVYRSQTLMNNGDTIACVNNTDCSSWPGTTCNNQYSNWQDSHGNQGNYCAYTKYPELEGGKYRRTNINFGGIGKACTTNNDCNQSLGYKCNNETNVFGTNVQQTGYCAQTYKCPGGDEKFLGYPYNSAIPIAPDFSQNNDGRGYSSQEECLSNITGTQHCVENKGKWFAVYPGLCPVTTNYRNNQGKLNKPNIVETNKGFEIPGYASNKRSFMTATDVKNDPWNINDNNNTGLNGPLDYELSINPF